MNTSEHRALANLLAPDIQELLKTSPHSVAAETEEIHAADLADVVEALPRESVIALLSALPANRAADVLEYLSDDLRTAVLEEMSTPQAARLVAEMTPDDRADALEELEEETYEDILSTIPRAAREETERLLAYDQDTAGGLMTTEFISVPEQTTVEDALASVRRIARAGRREAMHAIYTTDEHGRLKGVLSLRELLAAGEGAKIAEIAWEEVVSVAASADREEVVQLTSNYDLIALPVVDEAGGILGVVTVDDAMDAMVEEHTEDVQKFGGMEALDEPYLQIGFAAMMRKRVVWLVALFVGQMLTTSAMQQFQSQLTQALMLTLFIPLIISSGGNSGSQATSLIIRAMALGEVTLADWWRIARRELPLGLALGLVLGVLGVLRIVVWQQFGLWDYGAHYMLVALTVGMTLVGVVAFGSLAGSMLPFVLSRAGLDPASASAPLVATLVDVTGLTIYFSIALFLLNGILA
ncbi:MAG: magnesium transporter [Gemmatimonadaceae bacterium]|nr:magnesium transporter [Gemmatimonadaceae bacterium]